ncbi:hypothetical protein CMI41_00150 [Candidatus Pacearchaeota archaeon]|jgi:prefoldin subunit 5|nr:hypothetical protein [Candidatus Pacearchaeota archaeon]|tara:strand:- start:905 stop:1096 length:192 start_codon:yes stop_codon:yes gene_type:complete
MKKSNSQLEKNTTASFAYVKKDILMLNDAFSDLFDKMQKLSSRIEAVEEAAKKTKKRVVKRRR